MSTGTKILMVLGVIAGLAIVFLLASGSPGGGRDRIQHYKTASPSVTR